MHDVKTGQYNAATEGPEEVSPVYGADTTLDRLDLSTNPYLERHLEFMNCTWSRASSNITRGRLRGEEIREVIRGEVGRVRRRFVRVRLGLVMRRPRGLKVC